MYDCGGGPRHNYAHTASLLAAVIACLSFNIWNIDFQLSTRRSQEDLYCYMLYAIKNQTSQIHIMQPRERQRGRVHG